jgi:murein L,D-transpeptidase YafK
MNQKDAGGDDIFGGAAHKRKSNFLTLIFLAGLFSSTCFALEGSGDSKGAQKSLAVRVPASILYIGDAGMSYAFLVDKSEQRLYLYRQEPEGPRLLKTFLCATGENSGGKKSRGDKRTPEGVYFFTRVIESKNLSSIYGIRAFPMDYPNLLDRMDSLKGDGIWLHGTDKPLTPQSTNGCIVLDNRDVAELSPYIRFRQTPVIVEEKILYTLPQELGQEQLSVRRFLEEWKRSWETKQLDLYLSCYSENFRYKNMDRKGWRDYKHRLNQRYKSIQITMDTPILLRHNRKVVAVFSQSYRSDQFFNEGTKRLYLIPEGSDWKIIGEEWNIHRGGEAPPPIPQTLLAAFLSPKASSPKPERVASPAISGAVPEGPEPGSAQTFPEIQTFLAAWKQSWESKNLDQYMDCYSKEFRGQGRGWEQWREHKSNINALYRQIQVSLEGMKVHRKNGQTLVSFRQIYRSDGFRSAGQKLLVLRQEGDSWKILRENFSRSK